jgi:lipooligosaccharide transport system permease protein
VSSLSLAGASRYFGTALFTYSQTWKGSALSGFLGPLMYLGAIGFGLGSLVDTGGAQLGTVDGQALSYVVFLAPGLVAGTGMQIASGEAIFGTMAVMRWKRTFHTAVGTPLEPSDLALGHLAFCGLRGLLAALSYAVVIVLFGILGPVAALSTVLPATLTGLALSAPLIALMVLANSEQPMNAAQRFVVLPMFLFSGVFFPVSQLPGWLEPLAKLMPLWHGVELTRSWSLGLPSELGNVAHLLVLLGFIAGGFVLSMRTVPRRLRV